MTRRQRALIEALSRATLPVASADKRFVAEMAILTITWKNAEPTAVLSVRQRVYLLRLLERYRMQIGVSVLMAAEDEAVELHQMAPGAFDLAEPDFPVQRSLNFSAGGPASAAASTPQAPRDGR